MMRGERKARWLLTAIRESGLTVGVGIGEDGKPGFWVKPDRANEQQMKVATDVVLFACGYPGCYRTAVRIFQMEAAQ